MTRATNARIAGVTSFVYLAAGIGSLAMAATPHATDVLLAKGVSAPAPRTREGF
jgi:hypothetical protein